MFQHIEYYAGDPILSLVETFKKDPRETKVNLGIGIYYDDQGRLPLLPSVVKAETALAQHLEPRPYLPMEGLAAYRTACQNLLFGANSNVLAEKRVATVQTVGASGARGVSAAAAASSTVRAMPKSRIRGEPDPSTMMFAGLRSR